MAAPRAWLVLVHQLPPEPSALRVRVWRRLQAVGALALKGSVYLLPESDETTEDFEWLAREIAAAGAEATLLRAELVEGLSDDECVARFRAVVAGEYAELIDELQALARGAAVGRGPRRDAAAGAERRREVARARKRFEAISKRDFFAADGREIAGAILDELERGATGGAMQETAGRPPSTDLERWRGKTWVTRAGVHVDRMASAWLVRRFVDPTARFRFVTARHVEPAADEVRFDMFGGELTHEGESCTFEVMLARFGLNAGPSGNSRAEPRARGLAKIGEIVHDLDLKVDEFGHPECTGVAAALDGIVASCPDDLERIERAAVLFDGLLARFAKSR